MEIDEFDPLEICQYLWEEYKYRHDHIWVRIFQFTTAVVLISIIPYVKPDIAKQLGSWILMAPALATVLGIFVLVVMRNELKLFGKIKTAYRRRQNDLLDEDLKHKLDRKSNFNQQVLLYLGSLVALSIANGMIILFVWLQ
jgi:hypothetical protein